MKNKIFVVLTTVSTIVSCLVALYSRNINKQYERQIKLKDSLELTKKRKDSNYSKKTNEYSKIITKYISDCDVSIGSKKITLAELVKIANKNLNETQQLKDSVDFLKKVNQYNEKKINMYTSLNDTYNKLIDIYKKQSELLGKKESRINELDDSLSMYKKINQLIKRDYGIVYKIKTSKNTNVFTKDISAVDSAMIVFPLIKKQISIDTINHRWIISPTLQKLYLKGKLH
jgi:hypothetical protein